MESPEKSLRYRIILGKFPVTKVDKGLTGCRMVVKLPGSVSLTADMPVNADVKIGDLLTFYTEVLRAEPSQPPIQ